MSRCRKDPQRAGSAGAQRELEDPQRAGNVGSQREIEDAQRARSVGTQREFEDPQRAGSMELSGSSRQTGLEEQEQQRREGAPAAETGRGADRSRQAATAAAGLQLSAGDTEAWRGVTQRIPER